MSTEKPIQTQNSNQAVALATNHRDKIAAIMPKDADVDRYIGIIQNEINKNPDLASCTPATLVGSMVHCARLGLEPGLLNKIYLVPFNNTKKNCKECTVIIGYEGLADLVYRAGNVKRIDTRPVFKNDKIDVIYGDRPAINHEPVIFGDKGELIGFYAVAFFKDGGTKFEVMTLEDVDKIAERSKSAYIWKDHKVEMGRKTALRRLCKHLEKSVALSQAVELENLAETEQGQGADAVLLEAGIEYEKPATIAQVSQFEAEKLKAIEMLQAMSDEDIEKTFARPLAAIIDRMTDLSMVRKAVVMIRASKEL